MFASWDTRPEVRRTAHAALREMSDGFAPTSSHCLDAVVGDRLAVDALRGYERATRSTDLANELRSEMVDAMLDAVAARTGIWRRWNTIKAGLLGFDRLPVADRVAPLGAMAEMTYRGGGRAGGRIVHRAVGRGRPHRGRVLPGRARGRRAPHRQDGRRVLRGAGRHLRALPAAQSQRPADGRAGDGARGRPRPAPRALPGGPEPAGGPAVVRADRDPLDVRRAVARAGAARARDRPRPASGAAGRRR